MSVKKCAREECGKTVYPIEELKCLDKVWHKQCFKCTVCGMTLNMKNYKGYDKKPYCEPHYPKTVASVVTDTPEMRRLAENTKNQSQVKYHEDYEKMRGTRIQIADDPEMARHLANSRVQSQVQYHGELEKKMHQEANRPREELMASGGGSDGQSSTTSSSLALNALGVINECTTSTQHSRQGSVQSNNTNDRSAPYLSSAGRDDLRMIRSMNGADDFTNGQYINQSYYQVNGNSHAAIAAMSQSTHASYSSPLPAASNGVGNGSARMESPAVLADRLASMEPPSSATDGLSPYSQRLVNQAGTVVFSSEKNGQVPSQERKIGSIADYDPMNGNWGSTTAQNAGRGATQKSSSNTPATAAGDAKKMATKSKGITVKAIYGYTAADTDEVSFLENDIIVNCEKVDDGWMTGTVQRTLQYGMLPANYVERVNTPTGLHRLH